MLEYNSDSPSGLVWVAGRLKGRTAGTLDKEGYWAVQLKGKKLRCHRVVWELCNGPVPAGYVLDHINRMRSDNRIENLRLATVSDNNCNAYRPTRELPRGIYHNGKVYRAEFWKDGVRYRKLSGSLRVVSEWLSVTRDAVHGEYKVAT